MQDDGPYSPLDQQKDEIRVLILQAGDEPDEVHCTLETYQLDKCRAFEALSYAWGDPTPVFPIFVNGSCTLVAHNLSVALRHLRYTQSCRVLWIDAVCINQTDIGERNHQVFRMNRVYSTAKQVLVWLGEARGESDFTMKRLKELGEGQDVDANERSRLRGLINEYLMDRDWWGRLWIVQEVVLAQSDPIIMCGANCLSWHVFMKGCEAARLGDLTRKSAYEKKGRVERMIQREFLHQMRQQYPCRFGSRACKASLSLAQTLAYTKDFHVTDPRDKIYGCLGMLSLRERELIKPDYQKATELVFLEVTKYLLESGNNFFSHNSVFTSGETFTKASPSWVPDFTAQESQSSHNPSFMTRQKTGKGVQDCGQRCVSFQDHNRALAIAGFMFDTVEIVIELKDNQGLLLDQIPELERHIQHAVDKEILPDHPRHSFCKLKRHEDIWYLLSGGQADITLHLRDQYNILTGRTEPHSSGSTAPKGRLLLWAINCILPGRCFFVTSMGFFGIAVARVCKNDCVTFIFREALPIVLRPRGSSYIMVSAASVSGVMNGEAADICQSGLVEETTFLIR